MPFLIFLVFLLPLMIGIWLFDDVIVAFGFWVLCWAFVGGICYLYTRTPGYQKKKAEREVQRAEMDSLVSFDKETGVLTLYKRSPMIAKFVRIRESEDVFVDYKPVTLHVGAVTVGGVTTGGAYTTGGYHYIAAEKKNGLCTLEYGTNGDRITGIQLSEQDFADAEQSIVADYLDREKKRIVVVTDVKLNQWEREQALMNYKTTGYVGNKAAHCGKPTLEKALRIMDWLTTEK